MTWPFIPNQLYNRRADIHAHYGGQQQNGITTPARHPAIFVFTGHGASKVGYGDTWQSDGSLRYTGEGQVGDMRMTKGNLAIRDHARNGKDLLLFEKKKSGGPVRFIGRFYCAGWETERQADTTGAMRDAIVFTLVPADRVGIDAIVDGEAPSSLAELRAEAIAAAAPSASAGLATTTVYQRSAVVRRYVLARANGTCEACDTPAPFETAAGEPFLEAHHIRRVSDGGPDDPRHMAGICPNCHRRAHHGADAAAWNSDLAAKIRTVELAYGG